MTGYSQSVGWAINRFAAVLDYAEKNALKEKKSTKVQKLGNFRPQFASVDITILLCVCVHGLAQAHRASNWLQRKTCQNILPWEKKSATS